MSVYMYTLFMTVLTVRLLQNTALHFSDDRPVYGRNLKAQNL